MWRDKSQQTLKRIKKLIQNYDSYSREQFAIELEKLVRQKLLHIGVNTHDILKGYAAIVEYLSQCDPSFVLVHRICRIIREYVKQRPDTMRSIITFITTEKPGEDEQSQQSTANAHRLTLMLEEEQLQGVNEEYVIMVEDNNLSRWMDWVPDPIDANPKESRLFRESADVFNMLVSIYGSKDLFIKEYQGLLAERLLTNGWDRHLQSEFTYLETMKRRFTEGELNHCEVMLRDLHESWKLASFAAQTVPFACEPRVISFVYWPEMPANEKTTTFEPNFKEALEAYEKVFAQHKPACTINWQSDFWSQVELELEIDGQSVEIDAPLAQAQLIVLFTEKEQWDMSELIERTGLTTQILKRNLDWWSSKGLLVQGALDEITNEEIYMLTNSTKTIGNHSKRYMGNPILDDMFSDDEAEEEAPIDDVVEELEQYWNYTRNLLMYRTTSEPLTPQYLHRMFKNFTSPGKPVPSIEAVHMFMSKKIRQNLVEMDNGVYKAAKDLK